jgi:DHA1 family tetracycline resistance protein-like MFS transporter
MQFVFSPVMGALSDRYGRRRVLLISNAGIGIDYMLMAMAPNLWWLAVARIISGIVASNISTAFAYITDVTAPEKRAQSFGYIGACFGLGFILGPAMGGLLGEVDVRLPFWVAGGLALTNALYGFFVLPESLAPENRTPFSWRRANPMGSLQLLRSHPGLFGLATVHMLSQFATTSCRRCSRSTPCTATGGVRATSAGSWRASASPPPLCRACSQDASSTFR